MSNLIFRKTKHEDIEEVMKIYDDARQFMRENGNPDQWEGGHPKKSMIIEDIEIGRNYVCEYDGKLAAVFMFETKPDESYINIHEGSWKNDEQYGVIHRIAVSKDMHGKGIARACFDFCKNECISQGIKNLKIDTHKDNIPMQKALLKYGFSYCGIVYIYGVLKRMAYQFVIEK